MPFSQFKTTTLDANGKLHVSGPFVLALPEEEKEVTSLQFLVMQGDEFVAGEGGADDGGTWEGSVDHANNLALGPAEAFGIAVLVNSGPPLAFETYSWADKIALNAV
jgi:hypothetical protein